jgi:hypothetical protein
MKTDTDESSEMENEKYVLDCIFRCGTGEYKNCFRTERAIVFLMLSRHFGFDVLPYEKDGTRNYDVSKSYSVRSTKGFLRKKLQFNLRIDGEWLEGFPVPETALTPLEIAERRGYLKGKKESRPLPKPKGKAVFIDNKKVIRVQSGIPLSELKKNILKTC